MFSYGLKMENKMGQQTEYYGKYPAQIVDISDPENRMRVRVICPSVYNKADSPWAEACLPPGLLYTPPVGSYVWVEFFMGNPEYPIWVGQFYPDPTTILAESKLLARFGDTVQVTGTDPQGGALSLTGTITAASSNVKG